MAFTTETIEAAPRAPLNPLEPSQFNLPVKEYVAYDPKGTTSVTGDPLIRPETNATQTTTVEEKTSSAEPEVKLSPQVSALARKEAAQRQRELALKQREQALEARLADAEKYSQIKAKIASKDYSVAEELGLTYEEYLNYTLNKQAAKPEDERVKKVEEELTILKKAQEERVNQEYLANQALWKQEISKVVSENPEFSTVKELGAENVVLQHINDSFDEDGTELTAEQAAKEIEAALVERAEKFASVTKIKTKFSEPVKVLGPPKTAPKTITQTMTTTPQTPKSKPFHLMSESEQIAEAFRRVQAAKQGA